MISSLLKTLFGTKSQRDVKRLRPIVEKINRCEEPLLGLTDEQLKAKTAEFKDRIAKGETLDSLLPEAFAVVKNACRRMRGTTISVCGHELVWDMVPYDTQMMGGVVLHEGNIAEMATGEGKTLVATLPLYLNALSGRNCQLVTVNDYLALRDSEWMGAVYRYLGLTVGCIQHDMSPAERREVYGRDITYGTNSEFGFDYLRDMGMAQDKSQLVQRDHYYAIIDEVDSILIDEARTPLIISGPSAVSTHQYDTLKPMVEALFRKQNLLCSEMVDRAKKALAKEGASPEAVSDALLDLVRVRTGMPQHRQLMHVLEDGSILRELEKVEMRVKSDQNRGLLQEIQADMYFSMDERSHEADLTEKGRNEISPNDPDAFVLPDMLGTLHDIDADPALSPQDKIKRKQEFQETFGVKAERIHNISQLIRAYCLYEKDVHYVVQDNKVVIVDEHTGRLMPGRRFNEGLHQALEAKEEVVIEGETQTFATITIQNYFRMYKKMAGMTGTAETEAHEFHQTYKSDVVVIPTNRPIQRKDNNDCIYKTKREKYKAIVDEIEKCHQKGQPVLLGTVSVDVSEVLSRMLKRRGIPHNVLNAKNHQFEADIVARAGERGAVTVATNMAGRGTDIKLGEGVADIGGLHVLGSERHDSRRIDRQLRGRCARQGDPGSSRFYISLEDNLMRLFGSDKIAKVMSSLGLEEGEELQHPLLNRSIGTAQKRVEQQHFSIRKRTLEYDDVMNKQREVIYGFRKEALLTDTPKDMLFNLIEGEVDERVHMATETQGGEKDIFDVDGLLAWLNLTFPLGFGDRDLRPFLDSRGALKDVGALRDALVKKIADAYAAKEAFETPESLRWLERQIILDALDRIWQEHLYNMDNLRTGISLRSYAQKDPLVEYKQEAYTMFEAMVGEMNQAILSNLFRSATSLAAFERLIAALPQRMEHHEIGQFGQSSQGGGTSTSSATSTISQQLEGMSQEELQAMGQAMEGPSSYRRNLPKVGRNDPCPCGSGKKYKKCCGG